MIDILRDLPGADVARPGRPPFDPIGDGRDRGGAGNHSAVGPNPVATTGFLLVAVLVALSAAAHAGAAQRADSSTFLVQRVAVAHGSIVVLTPAPEFQRQYPIMNARLYGVDPLPAGDAYRRALTAVMTRLTIQHSEMAQVWPEGSGRSVRLYRAVADQWEDINVLVIREGAALARVEGSAAPYRDEARVAREARVGRHAYVHLAWFWANSVPVYAATLTPAAGPGLPFAIARAPAGIEAGYLRGRNVVLLQTGGFRFKYSVVDVRAKGPELAIATVGMFEKTPLVLHWVWQADTYRFLGDRAPQGTR